MSAAARFTQNGSLFSRFSQGSQFLVKILVKEKWCEVKEDPRKHIFPGFSLTKIGCGIFYILVKA